MGWVPRFNFVASTASRNLFELTGLSVLWLLWLVGCVVSTVRLRPLPCIVHELDSSSSLDRILRRIRRPLPKKPSPTYVLFADLQSIWPSLAFCYQFEACRVLTAMMAFAWLGWVVLVGLIVVAILSAVSKVRPTRSPMMVEWASPSQMARSVTV